MEGFHCLKFVLQKRDYTCENRPEGLNRPFRQNKPFSVPLHKESQNLVRFLWGGNSYEDLCLWFGLIPSPRIFMKLLKVPILVLRPLMIRVIIYFDDSLILGNSINEIFRTRGSVIFLLQHLGFVMNLKKCVIDPTQKVEFLRNYLKNFAITSRKDREDKGLMPGVIQSIRCSTSGFDRSNMRPFLDHSSSTSSPSTVSFLHHSILYL